MDPGGVTTWSWYKFPREQPSRQDWDQWINFWHEYTTTGGKLKTLLGRWINPTHRIWHWYCNKERGKLYHISRTTIKPFKQATGWQRTRLTTTYQITHLETSAQIFPAGIPTSVIRISESKMNKLQEGPLPPPTTEDSTPFWEFIDTWGGSWMWRDIDTGDNPKDNMQWVADGMTADTLIWMTDGSYDRKRATDLLGVGWIIFCKATGRRITGSFWERSITASLLRAELLGLCALHLLARAIAEYYDLGRWPAMMCCDNKQALLLSSHYKGRIRPSAKCTDIRRSFQATKQTYQGGFKYVHVYGHMDQHLSWSHLSITQRLNCICNTLAKHAVTMATIKGCHKPLKDKFWIWQNYFCLQIKLICILYK